MAQSSQKKKWIGSVEPTVVSLGFMSFFTDIASEMIYPVLPLFLTTLLGASPAALGVIEGIAESTAAFFKVFSGWMTDRLRRRKPFIVFGYGVGGLMRPLIAICQNWTQVLFIRFADRVGKGLRAAPRDALIADVTAPEVRGLNYGFERSMDHAGAVIGPVITSALLYIVGLKLRTIFWLTAAPGFLALGIAVFGVKEKAAPATLMPSARSLPLKSWVQMSTPFKLFLFVLLIFGVGNSTDAFLLLQLSKVGVPAAAVALVWSLHSMVKMVSATYFGQMTDRLGAKFSIISGWIVYSGVYFLFGQVTQRGMLIFGFLLYGIYYGLAEPAEKVFIAQLTPVSSRGEAFGFYHFTVGLSALPASILFGWLLQTRGAATAFGVGAGLSCAAAIALLLAYRWTHRRPSLMKEA